MGSESGQETTLAQPPLSSGLSRKAFARYSPATLRAVLALFRADNDAAIRRLFPAAADAVRKEGAVPVKGRRVPPQSIWKEIRAAHATMPASYLPFFTAILTGELGLPDQPDLFIEKRQQLTTPSPSLLLRLIRQLVVPLPAPPPIPSCRPRTWFRLVDRPDDRITLEPLPPTTTAVQQSAVTDEQPLYGGQAARDDDGFGVDDDGLEQGEIVPDVQVVERQAPPPEPSVKAPLQSPSDAGRDAIDVDDIVMEHEIGERTEDRDQGDAAHLSVSSTDEDESEFDLELDVMPASTAAAVAFEPLAGNLSDSDLSLDLDDDPPAAVPAPSVPPAAGAVGVKEPNASQDGEVSIREIASEIRRERRVSTGGDKLELGPVADFTKAFADVSMPSKSARKRPQKAKARPQSAKKSKAAFQRPAQRMSTPCQFWAEMRCVKGDQCPFSHDAPQVRRAEICRYFMMGACLKGDDCSHSHSVPCKFFHLQNTCRDADCRFSHDAMTEDELALFRARVEEGYYLKQSASTETDKTNAEDAVQDNPFLT